MTILARPNLTLEGVFDTSADGTRIWSNLTDYLELGEADLHISQRRQTLFDERSPGTLSFVLDNGGNEFTDTNTSSPFYPAVTYNTPLRVRMQYPVTANLLPGAVSRTDDSNFWTAQQGSLSNDTTSPATGVSSSVVWSTGVLQTTPVRVMVDTGIWANPGDLPVYVKAGEVYSASVQLRADAALSASLRLAWYDVNGNQLSEVSSSVVALTSSWQTLALTNQAAPANGTLRLAIASETTVGPVTAAIAYSGGQDVTRQWVTVMGIVIPDSANAGDVALAWLRVSDSRVAFTTPAGWTAVNTWTDQRGKTFLYSKTLVAADISTQVVFHMAPGSTYPCRVYESVITYTGADPATPVHKIAETTETVYRTAHTTPSVTTTLANCWIVSAVFDVASATSKWSAPVSETVRQYGFCVKGNAASGIITDDATAHAAGTYGGKAFTSNSSSKYATMHTIAIAPGAGTGPGNVNVFIGAPMLVKAASLPAFTTGGDWHSQIVAYADEWAPYWQANRALVAVSATDRSKLLATISVNSAVSEAVLDKSPIAYYMLNEQPASTGSGADLTTQAADSSIFSQPAMVITKYGTGGTDQALQFGAGTGPGLDGMSALMLTPTDLNNGKALLAENLNNSLGGGQGCSASLFFASTQGGTNEITILKMTPVTQSIATRASLEFIGKPGAYIGVKASVFTEQTTFTLIINQAGSYFTGATHMLSATWQCIGGQATLTFYLDGAPVSTQTQATSVTAIPPMNAIALGCAYRTPRLTQGTFSHVALFDTPLGDDDMADIYAAGTTAFAGEAVTDRLYRMMDWNNLGGTEFDTSDTVVDRHMPDETLLLDSMRLVVATDGGTLYIDGDDDIAFKSVVTKETEAVPTLTINAGDLATPPAATKNDQLLVNDITVNRLGSGSSQRLVDQASVTANGPHVKTVDTLAVTDEDARSICGYFVAFFSEPMTRFDTIAIEGLLLSDWTGLLSLDMWKIVEITGLPPGAPASTLDSFVEGMEWSVSADSWLFTADVSYVIPFAVVGDSVRGLMGPNVVSR